ncbi:ABC transporter [Alkalihalobacillus alcalophilus ATCC 27647 = CGMCC 1.3604]|uniref:ABC transporter n=1 Tax=Alkalihalobacillus alcalophilus ATCC 27647 = CGMCC 1.3604 TaxID=1218173 RepID=A0A094WIN2_ALKAL|nr:efflux RND transporter periplasmic adaptor subunit [Alkalihalobacillus alcalophilus]KGA97659.1 ABC transporter [Alkalihalobacillus alcalophilus ATCC 27647 = CGMCC 1.3604]MED1561306.1 efflux RND transporter periplasmic adaptor subunit [Alkalihalobacillus alcalophilus]THG91468.1 ABC transporter [Alkalihalobacillus alcalophilus ATCC 27647 = CGMCC 1.3604]
MSKKKVGLIVTLSVAGVLALGGVGFGAYMALNNSVNAGGEYEEWGEMEPYAMAVSDMMFGMEIYSPYTYSGKVEPEKSERVYYEPERGKILELFVAEGDTVEEGTPLFEYEPLEDYSLELDQLKMSLEMSYMQINRTTKQKERLEKQIKEAETKEEKEMFEEELEQINFDLRVSNLEAGQTQKQIAALEKDDEENANVVVAKQDGIVQTINQDIAEGATNEQTQGPLIQIVSTGSYFIKSQVNEFLLDTLEVGSQVRIMKKVYDGQEWFGTITDVGKLPVGFDEDDQMMDMYYGSNPQSSNYPFTVQIEEHEGLEIGFHVNMEPYTEQEAVSSDGVQIYDWFVVREEEEPYVWKVDENNLAYKQVVELGEENFDMGLVEILSGVSLEDFLVEPFSNVEEGSEVQMYDQFEEY